MSRRSLKTLIKINEKLSSLNKSCQDQINLVLANSPSRNFWKRIIHLQLCSENIQTQQYSLNYKFIQADIHHRLHSPHEPISFCHPSSPPCTFQPICIYLYAI